MILNGSSGIRWLFVVNIYKSWHSIIYGIEYEKDSFTNCRLLIL
jgi:hypothetical protein